SITADSCRARSAARICSCNPAMLWWSHSGCNDSQSTGTVVSRETERARCLLDLPGLERGGAWVVSRASDRCRTLERGLGLHGHSRRRPSLAGRPVAYRAHDHPAYEEALPVGRGAAFLYAPVFRGQDGGDSRLSVQPPSLPH